MRRAKVRTLRRWRLVGMGTTMALVALFGAGSAASPAPTIGSAPPCVQAQTGSATPALPADPQAALGAPAYVTWVGTLVAKVDDASTTLEDIVDSDEYDPTMDPSQET